ncbi:MAG: hypothetical protein UFG06_12235 [Lachnospiraceae bacterium]|nr:hypothetical protein [Lachnospiraceae bacterium]
MNENIMRALEIMGYGMAGIFAAIIIIIFFVWILQKMDSIGNKKESKESKEV